MRRKRKSARQPKTAFAVIIVLALLAGIAILVRETGEWPGKPAPARAPVSAPDRPPAVVKEYVLPELLIKGCLLDLGVNRPDIRFMGYTVMVTVRGLPRADRILGAFEPLEKAGEVIQASPERVRVKLNGNVWDIVFSVAAGTLAKCAIIIDDMGQSLQAAQRLGRIDANLTFAVLPGLPDSRPVAEHLHAQGREILLHLPMQGNGKNPGPGAIFEDMSPDEIRSVLQEDLAQVPFISGVNNHMGSVITSDRGDMSLVLGELKDDGLFFVDSMTTGRSVCGTLARDFGVPFVARDVFLDNELDSAYITGQIRRLVGISLRHSTAVGICHPHPETIAVLEKEIPKLKKLGVEVVRVSSLVEGSGNVR